MKHEAGASFPAMAILFILEAPDPRLFSTPVKMINDGLRTLIADMLEQIHDAPGIGLAV